MMKKVILSPMVFMLSMLWAFSLFSQEFTTNMNSGKIIIKEVNHLTIVGSSSSTVKMYTDVRNENKDARAEGLKEISPAGIKDNTGMGLSVLEEGNEMEILPVSKSQKRRFTLEVPKGVSVYFEHSSEKGGTVKVSNLSSEIEISTNYNSVELENVTGPAIINTVYGGIDATFESIGSEDVTLHSVYSHVDLSVPASAQASFLLTSKYGKILTDLDLTVNTTEGENKMRNLSNTKIMGDLNGGGTSFNIKATYSTIYLRKI
ncbi:MAG: hypothetical protein AAF824_16750 [Bacteroidota bacterium]